MPSMQKLGTSFAVGFFARTVQRQLMADHVVNPRILALPMFVLYMAARLGLNTNQNQAAGVALTIAFGLGATLALCGGLALEMFEKAQTRVPAAGMH